MVQEINLIFFCSIELFIPMLIYRTNIGRKEKVRWHQRHITMVIREAITTVIMRM